MARNRKIDFKSIFRRILVVILILAIAFAGIKFVTAGIWDGNRRFTIVVDGDPVIVFSIEPVTRQATVLTIPTQTILDVPYGYSSYPAGKVFNLGNLDKNRGGGKLLSRALENTFGVVVEGFVGSRSENKFSFQNLQFIDFKKTYFTLTSLLSSLIKFSGESKNIVTDLSYIDILRLWNSVRMLRSDQITVFDLNQAEVLSEEKLPDQTTVFKINKDLLDEYLSSKFQDKYVRLQNVSVEIINASEREKVAGQFSRILQHLGANVVAKSTAAEKANFNCQIEVSAKKIISSIIVERLIKFYRCGVLEGKEIGVADIKVILGKEFLK